MSDIDDQEKDALSEMRVDEETAAAAAEAGAIGGRGGAEGVPEEERPRVESGQGEAEGFELAEQELIEAASHGDPAPDPTTMAGRPEAERSNAEYGEADEERVSELTDSDRAESDRTS